jgi:hypothetical protein
MMAGIQRDSKQVQDKQEWPVLRSQVCSLHTYMKTWPSKKHALARNPRKSVCVSAFAKNDRKQRKDNHSLFPSNPSLLLSVLNPKTDKLQTMSVFQTMSEIKAVELVL